MKIQTRFAALTVAIVLLSVVSVANAQTRGQARMFDPVAFYFPGYDKNGDGKLDAAEWGRRGNFELIDADKNGSIDKDEFSVLYGKFGKDWKLDNPILPSANPAMDPSIVGDKVTMNEIGRQAICTITRAKNCQDGDGMAHQAGLMETGLGPVFPKGAFCLGIDETFAEPYLDKTGTGMHGGIDMPTDFGTPILAVANGTVIAKIDDIKQLRGLTVVLRHSPEDTGLPFWVFSEYAHLKELPMQAIGQRVRMGEVLSPTGNTGVKPTSPGTDSDRRPGIHFAVYYTSSPRFMVNQKYAIPENPRWMDPNALYRKQEPHDSQSMKDLPEIEKSIAIPVMFTNGMIEPQNTKLIWPYACKRISGT